MVAYAKNTAIAIMAAMMNFSTNFINFSLIACRRTLLTVGVLVYYTSKDITMSSVCLNPTSELPGVATDIYYLERPLCNISGGSEYVAHVSSVDQYVFVALMSDRTVLK